MRTVGVDLSAEARGTGIAVVDWDAGGGRLKEVKGYPDHGRIGLRRPDVVAPGQRHHKIVGQEVTYCRHPDSP